MWKNERQVLDPATEKFQMTDVQDERLSFREVLELWRRPDETGALFRTFFSLTLASWPATAFRWELPALNEHNLEDDFEFVLVKSDALDRKASSVAFDTYWQDNERPNVVLEFQNLGGDAQLVVPAKPLPEGVNACHLASFLRTADVAHCQNLWKILGAAALNRIGAKPVWINTAGGGVPWLHLRLDDRPKYYAYGPYRTAPGDR